MSECYLFDVNETLLDLRALDGRVFGGDAELRRRWFGQLMQSALVTTVIGGYQAFGSLAEAALAMVAPQADPAELASAMSSLPAHPDVRPALEALRGRGAQVAALTQSVAGVLAEQLSSAGIDDLLDPALSADDAGRLKPAPEPYRMAAERLGRAPREITMVAAHTWDVAGAAAAGLRTVLVARPGVVPDPSQDAPGRVIEDLRELAAG